MLTDLVENSLGWFWSKTISLGHNNVGFLFGGAFIRAWALIQGNAVTKHQK